MEHKQDTAIRPVERPLIRNAFETSTFHWVYDIQTGETTAPSTSFREIPSPAPDWQGSSDQLAGFSTGIGA